MMSERENKQKTLAIVGLGLIGGSLARAAKRCGGYTVLGMDLDKKTCEAALCDGAVDRMIGEDCLSEADFVFVCLHPRAALSFLLEKQTLFRKGSVVLDVCGIKTYVVEGMKEGFTRTDVTFVGAHPMAGREFSGYFASQENLFDGASLILTPDGAEEGVLCELKELASDLGFGKVVLATPEEHDRIIAFTSQLAHVVSSAYVKSPSLLDEKGFSAGSFQDLTRVAKLDSKLWCDLFLLNKKPLISEIDCMIERLKEYRAAIMAGDQVTLTTLLDDGTRLKLLSLESEKRD